VVVAVRCVSALGNVASPKLGEYPRGAASQCMRFARRKDEARSLAMVTPAIIGVDTAVTATTDVPRWRPRTRKARSGDTALFAAVTGLIGRIGEFSRLPLTQA
jgi:hypothetical protein